MKLLKNLLASLGGLVAVATLVPPTWYGQWLSRPWNETPATILIVLGGDSVREGMMGEASYWRSVYAVDVWREGHARRILLSGDPQTTDSMRTWIVGQGVPSAALTVENRSQTTRENALFTAELLRGIPGPYTLLTSDIHMRRAQAAFQKVGLDVLPRPAPDAFKRANDWRNRWRVFLDIVAESAKVAYYASKNWI